MELLERIRTLADASGVSGNEAAAAQTALEMLREFCPDAVYENGNVMGHLGVREPGKPHVLVDAHIDQIGMIVTDIEENGFLRIGNVGGLDRRLMPAQSVIIHGKEPVRGVICTIPPHLSGGKDAPVPKMEELAVDTGYSREQVSALVSRGDFVQYDTSCMPLLDTRLTGAALDDRCGVAAVLRMLELLQGETLPCSLTILFSSQEELGERGAKLAAYTVNPDIALAVDVSFGYTADDKPSDTGELGKGAMIGISPTLSRQVSNALIHAAEAEGLPYQLEVMEGLTSTNADRFSVARGGANACTVSIPLKYMHTPVEVIDTRDVELTAKLLCAYVRRCSAC